MYRYSFKKALLMVFLFVCWISAPAWADTVIVPGENLHVVIDIDHCDQSTLVCGGTGSVGAAATTNDSVVVMIVQVKANNGNAVGGLALTDFALDTVLAATGGVGLLIVDAATCPLCFSELPTGTYRLAVRPTFGNWGTGTYVTHLEVSNASGASARTVIPINIEP